jgi:oligoribonuclease
MGKKATLLWMDLEMTGLSPEKDRILEVGVVATDWDFEEIATYESGVKCAESLMRRRMVGDFWEKNTEVREALMTVSVKGLKSADAENELVKFVKANFSREVYLAGNSIHQDRKFIEKYWPKLDGMLHYRMLDVSAWKVYFEGAKGKKFMKPETHRAVDDIRGSIEELKWYLKMKF